jgi:hypothetical protein
MRFRKDKESHMDYETFCKWTAQQYWLKYAYTQAELVTHENWVTPQGNLVRVIISRENKVTAISKA